MKLSRSKLPLLVLPVLVAAATPLEGPAFGPEEGSTVTKVFTSNGEFELDDFSMIVDGQDLGGMIGNFEFSVVTDQSVTVTDTYVKMGSGRPKTLERAFDELSSVASFTMMADMGGDDQEVTSSSDLEGRTVVFKWNEDAGEFVASFSEGEGDEDLLEGLEEDMDLRCFLPEDGASVGDTWEVDLAELEKVVAPGGNLSLLPEEADAEMPEGMEDLFESQMEALSDLFDGTCECTYKQQREDGGVNLAEITIALEISSSADLSEMLMELVDTLTEQFGGEAPDFSFDSADLAVDFEGEGVLLWNLDEGRFQSLEIRGDVTFGVEILVSVDAAGDTTEIEASAEISGTMETKARAE